MLLAAIGDIHGARWKLEQILSVLPPEAQWIFLGDYVDRGPDIRGTIELLTRVAAERPETVFLRGNHDQWMLDAYDFFHPDQRSEKSMNDMLPWFEWGGAQTMASYRGNRPWFLEVPQAHIAFLRATAIEYRQGPFIFVHAGIPPPDLPDEGWDMDPRMWVREPFLASKRDFGGRVIFGHTVQRNGPLVQANKIGVDTGAVYGGPLTAVLLDTDHPDRQSFQHSSGG